MDWPVPGTISKEPLDLVPQPHEWPESTTEKQTARHVRARQPPEPEPEPEALSHNTEERHAVDALSPRTAAFEEQLNRPSVDMGRPKSLLQPRQSSARSSRADLRHHGAYPLYHPRRVSTEAMLERNSTRSPPRCMAAALGMLHCKPSYRLHVAQRHPGTAAFSELTAQPWSGARAGALCVF